MIKILLWIILFTFVWIILSLCYWINITCINAFTSIELWLKICGKVKENRTHEMIKSLIILCTLFSLALPQALNQSPDTNLLYQQKL